VKQPSPRCCSVLKRITSKTSRLSQIISEGFVTHLGKLKFKCKCDRHSNRNQIAEEALKSISEAAATPYGFHQMKSLLESDFLNIALSLPYLKM
jgi:PP-loop superfamily ATP-utilizing enzyme